MQVKTIAFGGMSWLTASNTTTRSAVFSVVLLSAEGWAGGFFMEVLKVTLEVNELLLRTIHDGIRDGIKAKLTGYNSPLEKIIGDSVAFHANDIRKVLSEAIESCLHNEQFREQLKTSTQSVLAKTLVQKFGGELEKQVNALKSDPATRARITLAIEEIVASK